MLGLHLISCIIFITCIFRASLLPLKHNTIINNSNNNNNYDEFKSYYYPSRHLANEVHDLPLKDNVHDDDSITRKSEIMESSASNYYAPHSTIDEEDEYSEVGATAPEMFESAKIKPIDNSKKLNIVANSSEIVLGVNEMTSEPNLTQLQQTQQVPIVSNADTSNSSSSKFSKLLFSSPSATVTSNGPSGPFKAIICHDCENSGGVNVGHSKSFSFSAIKSWNVGGSGSGSSSSSSNVAQKSSFNESSSSSSSSLVKQNHQDHFNMSGAVEHTSEKYFDAVINSNGNSNNNDNDNKKDPSLMINQNAAQIENQGSAYKAVESVTVNDSGQQPLSKDWNYSLLAVRNENLKAINSPMPSSSKTSGGSVISSTESPNAGSPKRPIFNDLLKVPYDVLNQPLTEAPPPPLATLPDTIKQTQIHINHQQKFNDTITNYQHFQQFIQKSPAPLPLPSPTNAPASNHYQSTQMPEQNYEVDESVSLMTNGRAHGVQSTTPHVITEKNENHHSITSPQQQQQPSQQHQPSPITQHDQDAKFGVVFEGRDFRKYKVEEKTADGFIVGEYGYLSNTDGSPIFGVRYTADSNINPQLIYDALLKFLKL